MIDDRNRRSPFFPFSHTYPQARAEGQPRLCQSAERLGYESQRAFQRVDVAELLEGAKGWGEWLCVRY